MLRLHVAFTWSAVQFNRNLISERAVEVCVATFEDLVRGFGLHVSSLTRNDEYNSLVFVLTRTADKPFENTN